MKLQSNKKKRTIIILSIVLGVLLIGAIIGIVINLPTPSEIVDPKEITGITISSLPTKKVYYTGEEFDPTGTKIQTFTNDTEYSEFIGSELLTFSGFDSSSPVEEQVITVSYKGFTTTFNIKIIEKPSADPVLADIEICDFKTTYTMSDWNKYGPDVRGASIKCIYTDDSIKEGILLQSGWIYGYQKVEAPGTLDLVIKYNDGGVLVETTVTVTITE